MKNSDISSTRLGVRVIISGKVQRVGYRFSTLSQARKLGVKGWVRNLSTGEVEAVFTGDRTAIEQMVKWCHRGSVDAVVNNVTVEPFTLEEFKNFEIKY
jgi:acylphosphatase